MTSHGRNTIGSAIGKSSSVCDLISRTFVAGFGWNTFLRWAANVSALSLSLRAQQPAGVLIGVTVTVGGLIVEWAFHSGNFELDGDSGSIYRCWDLSSSCRSALVSRREASFLLLLCRWRSK